MRIYRIIDTCDEHDREGYHYTDPNPECLHCEGLGYTIGMSGSDAFEARCSMCVKFCSNSSSRDYESSSDFVASMMASLMAGYKRGETPDTVAPTTGNPITTAFDLFNEADRLVEAFDELSEKEQNAIKERWPVFGAWMFLGLTLKDM